MRNALWLAVLLGCTPRLAAPQLAKHAPDSRPSLHCQLHEGVASCASVDGGLQPISLDFAVVQLIPRLSGGLWLLGEHGELVRLNPRGQQSGHWHTGLRSLASTRDLLCGTTPEGTVQCARDFRPDSSCDLPDEDLGPWTVLPLRGPLLASDARGQELCARDEDGRRACLRVRPSCDSICLSFPACAPVRCVDACGPDERALGLRLEVVPRARDFFSAATAGAET